MDLTTERLFMGAAGAGGPTYWLASIGSLDGGAQTAGYRLTVDSQDNLIVSGYTTAVSGGSGSYACLVKCDKNGNFKWGQAFKQTGYNTYGTDVTLDSSNDIYVSAWVSLGGINAQPIKLNSDASAVSWAKTAGSSGSDRYQSCTVDSSGNIYFFGFMESGLGTNTQKVALSKHNNAGARLFNYGFGNNNVSGYNGEDITIDGSYLYGVGQAQSFYPLIVKYDLSGTVQWARELTGLSSNGKAYGVSTDSSGNVYVVGDQYVASPGRNVIFAVKYNSSGTLQWQSSRQDPSSYNLQNRDAAVDSAGNLYVISARQTVSSLLITKFSSGGVYQWTRSITASGASFSAGGIEIDSEGSLCVSGYVSGVGPGTGNIFLARLPSDGSLTGTYGSFTYGTLNLTSYVISYTSSASSGSVQSIPTTISSSTLGNNSVPFTTDLTAIA